MCSPGSRSSVGSRRDLLLLAVLSVVVGLLAGLVAALFRLALQQADRGRSELIAWAGGFSITGFVLVVGTISGAAALAAWLVRRFAPSAAGSGIPNVEAAVAGELPPAPFPVLPVKFFGGWLALGAGLALGREGPSVQMGACFGAWLGRVFRLNSSDCIALLAAGGGAGLATAFNAPIAGAVFVLEELVRRFDLRIALTALGASGGAIAVARWFLGQAPDFAVPPIPFPGPGSGFWFLGLGLVAGLVGVAYNRSLIAGLAWVDRFRRWPMELRAGLVGAAVGAVGWWAPAWIGSGDELTQQALSGGGQTLGILPALFAFRFLLSVVSYTEGTPGGLFAPLLALGAQLGLLVAAASHELFPELKTPAVAFAVVGMAALFTAVVRAPATGLILVTELTGNVTLLLPMLAASFGAMLIPALLGNRPIYDSLKERTLRMHQG